MEASKVFIISCCRAVRPCTMYVPGRFDYTRTSCDGRKGGIVVDATVDTVVHNPIFSVCVLTRHKCIVLGHCSFTLRDSLLHAHFRSGWHQDMQVVHHEVISFRVERDFQDKVHGMSAVQ